MRLGIRPPSPRIENLSLGLKFFIIHKYLGDKIKNIRLAVQVAALGNFTTVYQI